MQSKRQHAKEVNKNAVLLQYEINEIIAIIIPKIKDYEKGFYQGILKEVNDDDIVIDIDTNNSNNMFPNLKSFKYDTFIFGTPLERYH